MPAAARGTSRAAPTRAARAAAPARAAGGRPAAAPASPPGRGKRHAALADAAAEVEAAEGGTACREAALVLATTAGSLSKSAPPAKAPKNSNDGGYSAAANYEIREPSDRIVHNENAKALAVAARTAADAVREKERIQGELDKMKAWLMAAEQGSGGRKPPNKPRLSNGGRRTKKARFCDPITGCEKVRDALL